MKLTPRVPRTVNACDVARLYARAGDVDRAMEFDQLRRDARFRDLLRRLKLLEPA